ncbi:uncharacterized protein ARMOST_16654 [Armillaria ostoyae]|uniref:Uncharacterized protein n=1 Tax=Armillaria ostoyae TaxID=47428 RepID=A0A284RWT7_ARMOS|nr:uncharacterized protein ARMOST_16654 [Armillaria ostoyae]
MESATYSLTSDNDSDMGLSLGNQEYEKQLRLGMESVTHSLTQTGNHLDRDLSLRMQRYEKLLLSARRLTHNQHNFLLENMNDYLHAIFDGRRKAWWSLFLPQFIALYPDTILDQHCYGILAHQWSVQSLQEHLEEWMDRNGSGLAKDGYALERHILRVCEQQVSECHQDEESVGTERLTEDVSVSDESDGSVDTSTTAQFRRWRLSISETMVLGLA